MVLYLLNTALIMNCISGTNAEINFEIMGPTPTSLFRVDMKTGLVLTVMTVEESHSDQCYNLTVLAKDEGVPQNTATATVMICIIDFNDGPQFNQAFYNFTLPENLPAGTKTHNSMLLVTALLQWCRYCCWYCGCL